MRRRSRTACCPPWAGRPGLTLAMQLAKEGFPGAATACKLLGANPETIRQGGGPPDCSRTPWSRIGEPCIPSKVVTEPVDDALDFADEIGYPVIVRPGLHPGRQRRRHSPERRTSCGRSAGQACGLSPIHQILVEKCIAGWKEIEFEVDAGQRGQRHHRLLAWKTSIRWACTPATPSSSPRP